jgi:hypothetical protein
MNSPKYSHHLPTDQLRNPDAPQNITFGTVEVRTTRPAFVRYHLDDRIYLTNLHLLVLPSIWMVYGCIIDGAPV